MVRPVNGNFLNVSHCLLQDLVKKMTEFSSLPLLGMIPVALFITLIPHRPFFLFILFIGYVLARPYSSRQIYVEHIQKFNPLLTDIYLLVCEML